MFSLPGEADSGLLLAIGALCETEALCEGEGEDGSPRSARNLCQKWSEAGFIVAADVSKKGRKYKLAPQFVFLLEY